MKRNLLKFGTAVLLWIWNNDPVRWIRRRLVYYGEAIHLPTLFVFFSALGLILIPPGMLAVPSLDYPARLSGRAGEVLSGHTFRMGEGEEAPVVRLYGVSARSLITLEGRNAKKALKKLLGTERLTCRRLLPDPSRRFVARCTLPDGRDVAQVMLARGRLSEECLISGNAYGTCTRNWARIGRVTSRAVHWSEGGLRMLRRLVRWIEGG